MFRPQKALKKTRIKLHNTQYYTIKLHNTQYYTIKLYNTQYYTTKLHNTPAFQALLYGNDNWTITARDARRITAAGMKYMRKTAGYIWAECGTNTEKAEKLI
jgi:hypothetical protein